MLFEALCNFVSESVSPEEVASTWKERETAEKVVQVVRIALEKLRLTFDKFLEIV
jgi:Na+-transporting methylmalonyl-CoA/oxaloacetate decarboxylase gamma subunit